MKLTHDVNINFRSNRCKTCDWDVLSKLMDLSKQGELVMATISEYIAKQDEYNAQMDKTLGNLRKDIEKLNGTIQKLQTTNGEITAEDQSLLDKAQANTEKLLKAMGELDQMTAPDTTEVEQPEDGGDVGGEDVDTAEDL